MAKKKQNVALVLSGGGARGLAHVGVIEELKKRGYKIASIAGTSMGALIGGVYARGKLNAYKKWVYTLDRGKVFSLVDFTFSSNGLVKGDRVLNAMKEFIPDCNIEDLKINFSATATDIANHKEIVFRKGSLYKAIRASIAIPTIFTPVINDGAIIVDGGVMNNLPIKNVKRNKGDLLVASYVNADIPFEKEVFTGENAKKQKKAYRNKLNEFYDYLNHLLPENNKEKLGYFTLLDKTLSSMTYQLTHLAIENNPPDLLIQTSRQVCGTYDFYKAGQVVETGRKQAIEKLDEFEKNKVKN